MQGWRGKVLGLLVFAVSFVIVGLVTRHFFSGPSDDDPLTGPARDAFISSAREACLKTQTEAPANASVEKQVIVTFCDCYVDEMAKKINVGETKQTATAGKIGEALLAKTKAAAEACYPK